MVLGGGLLKQFACFALVFLQMVAREIGNTKIELGRGIFVVGLCSSKARVLVVPSLWGRSVNENLITLD